MKSILCIVQEHMFDKSQIKEMQNGFKDLYRQHYSDDKTKVLWMIMPKGYAYSERKDSEATIILFEVDEDITQEKRESLMSIFSNYLLSEFKISPLDSIITVANSSFVNTFIASQQNRVKPSARKWIKLKTMTTAISSTLTNGYARLRVRM